MYANQRYIQSSHIYKEWLSQANANRLLCVENLEGKSLWPSTQTVTTKTFWGEIIKCWTHISLMKYIRGKPILRGEKNKIGNAVKWRPNWPFETLNFFYYTPCSFFLLNSFTTFPSLKLLQSSFSSKYVFNCPINSYELSLILHN